MNCSPTVEGVSRERRTRPGLLGLLAAAALLCTGLVSALPALAQTPPTIDGTIDDLINYAAATDQACLDTESLLPDQRPKPGDICKTNALLIPCTAPQVACVGGGGTYFLNGFDLTRAVVAYDRVNRILYVGSRVAGIIGDSDGDGTANAGVGCTPPLDPGQQRISDGAGVGFQESYSWGLDTDCNGKSDILIRTTIVADVLALEVQGATSGTKTVAFNGSDIEGKIENFDLPFVFAMNAFAGSTTDGLSEDASAAVQCGPPEIDLSISKVAVPPTICPDGTTTFTITVQNTGEAPLTTTLTDQLPADLIFDNNVTGDFTFQSHVAGLLTFNTLVLPAGATRTASFRALASSSCFGVVRNTASATGTFTEPCIEAQGKGPLSVTRSANFDVTCKDQPCVTLVVNPIAPQCEGTPVTITGSATNCSQDPETITVSVVGGGSQNLGVVAAGASANFSIPAGNLLCKTGSETFTVNAVADGECAPDGTDTETVTVDCLDLPCVTMTVNPLAPQCEGTPVTITGSVRNCSDDPETIVVQLLGGGSQNLGSVASGATVNFSIPAGNLACVDGSRTFSLTATASNACPPAATDTKTVTIDCVDTPCVQLTVNPLAPQCEGTPVTITGSVRNCSDDPEGIVVQLLGGGSDNVGTVQPGQTANWSIPAGNLDCVEGNTRTYTLTATAAGGCPPNGTDTKTVTITCLASPCVQLTVNPLDPRCEGASVTITGSVRNCSTAAETIVVSVAGGGSQNLGSVAAGATVNFSIPVANLVCVEGSRTYSVTATATGACEPAATDTKTVTVICQVPQIDVEKTGPTSVANGATISYVITVSNPSLTVGLEDIVVTDVLCAYVSNPRNFGGTCPTGAPIVVANTITWPAFDLAANSSCTITFDVTADVAAGGASCPTRVNCVNVVRVHGFCVGSNGQSRVDDIDEFPTEIVCVGENCPRTPGFWTQQCAQKGNGSTKFTRAQVTAIAECIDNTSSFFNWAPGTDFDLFCRNINPSTPMDQRKQARRQFAAMLANYCTDQLDLSPNNGGVIILDPSTPVSCAGFDADTIGELIVEIDALLAELQGQDLNDPAVKSRYGQIISCVDDINNGRSIPVREDCEDGGTNQTDDSEADLGGSESGSEEAEVAGGLVQLYRPSPNPFSGVTHFAYAVTGEREAAVEIAVYNVAGRAVKKLVASVQVPGRYDVAWDGTDDSGVKVTRGVYFVRTMIAGLKQDVVRILYVRD